MALKVTFPSGDQVDYLFAEKAAAASVYRFLDGDAISVAVARAVSDGIFRAASVAAQSSVAAIAAVSSDTFRQVAIGAQSAVTAARLLDRGRAVSVAGQGTVAVTGSVASPQITSVAMSGQNTTTGNVPVEITASADGTFPWILTSIDWSVTPPSVAQVNAGNGQDGSAAEDSGSVTTTGGTGVLDALTTGLNESLWLVVADVDSVHFDATAEAIDTRVPSLSSPTAVSAGATSIDAGVTSNLAGGEIFFAARLASDPVLSISDIENGTGDAVATASDATPTADGNNAATLTGLTTGTAYDIDSFQRRLGQESAVATSAAASLSVTRIGDVNNGTGTTTITFSGATLPTANETWLIIAWKQGFALNSGTIDGNAITIEGGSITGGAGAVAFVRATSTANASGNIVLNFASVVVNPAVAIFEVAGRTTTYAAVQNDISSGTALDLSEATAAARAIFAGAINENGSVMSWGGDLTEGFSGDISTNEWVITGYATGVASGSKTIEATWSTSAKCIGASIAIS